MKAAHNISHQVTQIDIEMGLSTKKSDHDDLRDCDRVVNTFTERLSSRPFRMTFAQAMDSTAVTRADIA